MLIDVLRVAVILVGSGLVCIGALLAAPLLGLERLWNRFTCPTDSPQQVIAELSALADSASQGGVLSVESAAASSSLPLLKHGIALAIAGVPADQVKAKLGADLDRSLLVFRRRWSTLFSISMVLLIGSILTGAALQLLVAASVASPAVISSIPGPLLFVTFPLFLGIACLPTLRDWTNRSDAAHLLMGTLVIEGVILIGSAKDGHAVADHLARLLPGFETAQRARAAAA